MKYPKTLEKAGRNNGLVMSMETRLDPLTEQDMQDKQNAQGEKEDGIAPLSYLKPWAGVAFNFADSSKNVGGYGNIEANHIADVKIRTAIAMEYIIKAEISGKVAGTSDNADASNILATKVSYLPREMADVKGSSVMTIAQKYDGQQVFGAADLLDEQAAKGGQYADSNRRQAYALRLAAVIVSSMQMVTVQGENLASAIANGRQVQQDDPAYNLYSYALQLIGQDDVIRSLFGKDVSSDNTGSAITIYRADLKTPHKWKVDSNGLTDAYSLKVFCYPEHTSPFHVELETMKGKPLQGRPVGIQGNTVTDKKKFVIDLTSWEWNNMVEKADWEKKLVEMYAHPKNYSIAVYYDEENRKASRNN